MTNAAASLPPPTAGGCKSSGESLSPRAFAATGASLRRQPIQKSENDDGDDEEWELDPAAGLSSASSCVSLSLPIPSGREGVINDDDDDGGRFDGGNTGGARGRYNFRPVFTHQLFDDERVRGWQPAKGAQSEARDAAARLRRRRQRFQGGDGGGGEKQKEEGGTPLSPPHKSYGLHGPDDGTLDVRVTLAPSCRRCSVLVRTEVGTAAAAGKRPVDDTEGEESTDDRKDAKRPRSDESLTSTMEKHDAGSNTPKSAECKAVRFVLDATAASGKDGDTDGSPGDGRMEIKAVLERVNRALPPVSSTRVIADGNKEEQIGVLADAAKEEEMVCDYLDVPMGTILRDYSRRIKASTAQTPQVESVFSDKIGQTNEQDEEEEEVGEFVLSLSDGSDPSVAQYHSSVQNLALWFIENADGVDVSSDEGGGYWKVLYLFRRHTFPMLPGGTGDEVKVKGRYSLAGYVTLFHFHAPFKKPRGGLVLRICQALVLPPYQRAGHGSEMMKAVYEYAEGKYDYALVEAKAKRCLGKEGGDRGASGVLKEDIVEVNVEDPAPAFEMLRDATDYRRFKRLLGEATTDGKDPPLDWKYVGEYSGPDSCGSETDIGREGATKRGPGVEEGDYFTPLPDAEAIRAGAELRVTPRQVRAVHEMLKMESVEAYAKKLLDSPGAAVGGDSEGALAVEKIEQARKSCRLMMKKNLLKRHKEELGALASKEARKVRLGELFDAVAGRYRSILQIKQ